MNKVKILKSDYVEFINNYGRTGIPATSVTFIIIENFAQIKGSNRHNVDLKELYWSKFFPNFSIYRFRHGGLAVFLPCDVSTGVFIDVKLENFYVAINYERFDAMVRVFKKYMESISQDITEINVPMRGFHEMGLLKQRLVHHFPNCNILFHYYESSFND